MVWTKILPKRVSVSLPVWDDMDVDTRYNTRLRSQTHLHKGVLGLPDDSGGECELTLHQMAVALECQY